MAKLHTTWLHGNLVSMLTAAGILAAFLVAALLVRLTGASIMRRYLNHNGSEHEEGLVCTLRSLLTWVLVLAGVYYSLASLPEIDHSPHLSMLLSRALDVIAIIVVTWAVIRAINLFMMWRTNIAVARGAASRDITHQINTLRKVLDIIVFVIALLYILSTSGVNLSPLLASGAVGGLAVALAAQDTLSNLFAGFYLGLDRPIREGDFIQLESGQQGTVMEIGWRNTRIRLLPNNVVVIPNAKLSQSVFTNYTLPVADMSLYVNCGVAYDSDLELVERVTLEVASSLQAEIPGADPTWTPSVTWKEFANSSINFTVGLRVKEFNAQYKLQSEFIKAIYKRFNQEGINIPFPTQTVYLMPSASTAKSDVVTALIGQELQRDNADMREQVIS